MHFTAFFSRALLPAILLVLSAALHAGDATVPVPLTVHIPTSRYSLEELRTGVEHGDHNAMSNLGTAVASGWWNHIDNFDNVIHRKLFVDSYDKISASYRNTGRGHDGAVVHFSSAEDQPHPKP